jgi:hypothetical protein
MCQFTCKNAGHYAVRPVMMIMWGSSRVFDLEIFGDVGALPSEKFLCVEESRCGRVPRAPSLRHSEMSVSCKARCHDDNC